MTELRCCNDTYTRDAEGWRYPWGSLVPGASDLTLADLLAIDGLTDLDGVTGLRAITPAERRWLAGDPSMRQDVLLRHREGRPPNAGDIIVGMMAPELHALTMLTASDIAELAGVSKATIDSYRYRGYLPEPQATGGRTPLWARPIVHHWLLNRPGSGWRSDIYNGHATARGRRARRVERQRERAATP